MNGIKVRQVSGSKSAEIQIKYLLTLHEMPLEHQKKSNVFSKEGQTIIGFGRVILKKKGGNLETLAYFFKLQPISILAIRSLLLLLLYLFQCRVQQYPLTMAPAVFFLLCMTRLVSQNAQTATALDLGVQFLHYFNCILTGENMADTASVGWQLLLD